jgi:hypothetical protein
VDKAIKDLFYLRRQEKIIVHSRTWREFGSVPPSSIDHFLSLDFPTLYSSGGYLPTARAEEVSLVPVGRALTLEVVIPNEATNSGLSGTSSTSTSTSSLVQVREKWKETIF